ncbi:hypothetical protein AMJ87_08565 [candidate division WOR_3 bacterium SM23_60]|uniref:Methyltransferase type 11 domain-containing protein n=1 Tax=candidate division WOR_3 bacterium SM23_60 TaxID=1703780 RepID=A0A0S8GES2_UNCW3|nr:MAG: hypothetical protein AMJ87_08565 [candidate division WOR_3 bacterium SM23_60]
MPDARTYWESHFASAANACAASRQHAACLEQFHERYLQKDGTILDLACGLGRNARYLAQNGYDVYGVDFARAAITACTRLFQKQFLKGTFIQATVDAIPFCNNHFDAVICIAALDHVTADYARDALCEIRRVITRDGMILLTFDHPETDEDKLDQTHALPDGTLLFIRGKYQGMLFRRYQDEEIKALVGAEHICSFDYGKEGSRVVVCR